MKIYAPVKDFNGVRYFVRFINGVGETNDVSKIPWFKEHGYKVVEENQRAEMVPAAPEREPEMLENTDQPDFESMTPNDIREWAKANGHGLKIKNIRNKEKLIELLRG